MKPHQGLYNPQYEHDACGVGFVANVDGARSHEIVVRGIRVLENLLHRGAAGGDEKTGDGAGILIQIPDEFLQRECGVLGLSLPAAGRYGVGMLFLPPGPGSFRKMPFDFRGSRARGRLASSRLAECAYRCFCPWRQGRVRMPDCGSMPGG